MSLAVRSNSPEAMNDPDTPPEVLARCLADLARVNRLTRTHVPTLRFLARSTRGWPRGAPVSVLDVGYGQGDLLRAVHRWARRAGLVPVLAGIDIDPRSAAAAAAATPAGVEIAWLTGDVFAHRPDPLPDFVVSSQFAHHLEDGQVVAFLEWMERHARRGWFVADLHRHAVAHRGFPLLARVMRWHRIIREDGTISIARGFRSAEWAALLQRAGISGARVSWHVPFRLCVARAK